MDTVRVWLAEHVPSPTGLMITWFDKRGLDGSFIIVDRADRHEGGRWRLLNGRWLYFGFSNLKYRITVLCVVLWMCLNFPLLISLLLSSLLSDKCYISLRNGGLFYNLYAFSPHRPPPQQGVKYNSLHIWQHNGMKSFLKDEINSGNV